MKIEAALAAFSPCSDRFVTKGYREDKSLKAQLEEASKVDGLDGVAFNYPTQFTDPVKLKNLVEEFDLEIGTVCADVYTQATWKYGSLASENSEDRKRAVQLIKDALDVAYELQAADVLLWLAHDGYDYPFQDNYARSWNYIIEGIREAAQHRDDVKLTIEYKPKEPRTHLYVSTVGKSLLICEEINLPNLGVVLDLGHSLFAYENPAESIALLNRYNRLFHIHLNDNYREWDDDLLLGSVHFWETLEFFYWLNEVGYDGWYTIDIWPRREDGMKALNASVKRIRWFKALAENLPSEEIKRLQKENKTMDILELVRGCLGTG